MNKAISFYFLNELDSSLKATNNVILLAPTLPNVYKFREKISDRFMLLGVQEFEKGDVKNGMKNLLKSVASNKSQPVQVVTAMMPLMLTGGCGQRTQFQAGSAWELMIVPLVQNVLQPLQRRRRRLQILS
jgi:hypothetical protein